MTYKNLSREDLIQEIEKINSLNDLLISDSQKLRDSAVNLLGNVKYNSKKNVFKVKPYILEELEVSVRSTPIYTLL